MRIAIRGFAGQERLFEEVVDIDPDDVEDLLPGMAQKHREALAGHKLFMIEAEFLDEPNEQERFLRFGSDPRRMVRPIALDTEQLSLDRKPMGLPDNYPD